MILISGILSKHRKNKKTVFMFTVNHGIDFSQWQVMFTTSLTTSRKALLSTKVFKQFLST